LFPRDPPASSERSGAGDRSPAHGTEEVEVMAIGPFDPAKSVTFDLTHGQVHLEGAPSRVLVPAAALAAICAAAGADATAALGRALGEAMGRRIATRFGGEAEGATSVRSASLEAIVDHLGGELALAGLGSLGIERWGRALVLVVDQSPLGAQGDGLLAAVLESALEQATARSVRTGLLGRDAVRTRFLVAAPPALERVRAWIGDGLSWGEALTRLHAAAPAARGEA
jgi:hypothetical protein